MGGWVEGSLDGQNERMWKNGKMDDKLEDG